jgi:CheY-like chemotaxis protein
MRSLGVEDQLPAIAGGLHLSDSALMANPPSRKGAFQMKILVVDDSKFQGTIIQRTLARNGHAVILAVDGEEGLRLARQETPDVILLDMMLPRVDGPTVLQTLKNDPATVGIPVIVLSALSQRNEAKLKEAGSTAFYQKSELGIEKGMEGLVDLINQVRPGAVLS